MSSQQAQPLTAQGLFPHGIAGVIFDCDLKPSGHLSLCLHNDIVTMDLETGRGTVSACRATNRMRFRVNLDETRWWGCDGRRA